MVISLSQGDGKSEILKILKSRNITQYFRLLPNLGPTYRALNHSFLAWDKIDTSLEEGLKVPKGSFRFLQILSNSYNKFLEDLIHILKSSYIFLKVENNPIVKNEELDVDLLAIV